MATMSDLFGSMVFGDRAMSARLPKDVYRELKICCAEDRPLSLDTANVIANAMKDWAIEKGVTHFTHWFQPMTGVTAEKHDSFISPTRDGGVIMEFNGKELIKGEPDASSFPSGGLRATFEARGYTAWDPTSYAFIKDGVLCIPTAFCSYTGDALDKKTPLLRSMEAINRQATRILKLFGRKTERIIANVGPEQEYFLIDTAVFEKRRDLFYAGRTLFGAKPPKTQQLDDHYFGPIKPRIAAYMKDLDEELWKLGILAKSKHNEAAPSQHELAPIFTTASIATDHNQLTMELMQKVAKKHGMTCILHEKPFAGVNGSGKHVNWSLSTNFGYNLFDPGKSPEENAQFLLILSAVISAVDKHQDLLRISVASAGNDHRLGGDEAPPAIVSMYLGDELTGILQAIADSRKYSKRAGCEVEVGVHVLPRFAKDSTDRNRTSPFAFTGNKFEFRMLGSASSTSDSVAVLNTILADEFSIIADELENTTDFNASITAIIRRTMQEHGRIIFNGNNYSQEWVAEAEKRGLLNLPTTIDALPLFTSKKNVELFSKHGVFTEREMVSRQEILIENYCKLIDIEANAMVDMAMRDVLPAVRNYLKFLSDSESSMRTIGLSPSHEKTAELCDLYTAAEDNLSALESSISKAESISSGLEDAKLYRDEVIPAMNKLRATADEMEKRTAKTYWPFPDYGDLMFSIK